MSNETDEITEPAVSTAKDENVKTGCEPGPSDEALAVMINEALSDRPRIRLGRDEIGTWIRGLERTHLAVGDTVEWDVSHGTDRGIVSAITETRIYVRNQRRGTGKVYNCEFWWDAHEVHKLRRVAP